MVWLQKWIADSPERSRHRSALALCQHWQWYSRSGRLKNFAARSFLLKLEQRGLIRLPPIREAQRRHTWSTPFEEVMDDVGLMDPIADGLDKHLPLSIVIPQTRSKQETLFRSCLARHHYLGFGRTVGENLQYLIYDQKGRHLACLLFGSAAWRVSCRDHFIGWRDEFRQRNLSFLTNNTRFLILPWVNVPHLASHILGKILRRLSSDWQEKYGHPIHLVETFVQKDRFRGTCYQASNWIHVGETKGRSRQDRNFTLQVPIKDIYLYPLKKNFREVLC